jgi:hypothetical protein
MLLYEELYTIEFHNKLKEIQKFLAEAYKHAAEDPDRYGKASEGWIRIDLPPYFWIDYNDRRPEIEIYSYVLGPSRMHSFANIDDALEAVKYWHKQELSDTDPADYVYPEK